VAASGFVRVGLEPPHFGEYDSASVRRFRSMCSKRTELRCRTRPFPSGTPSRSPVDSKRSMVMVGMNPLEASHVTLAHEKTCRVSLGPRGGGDGRGDRQHVPGGAPS